MPIRFPAAPTTLAVLAGFSPAFLPGCRPPPVATDTGFAPLSPVEAVNPMVGTGGQGYGVGSVYPGVGRPFGLVKVSPDTRGDAGAISYAHCAGYWYEDPYITGFSQVHLYGAGIPDYGNVLLYPAFEMSEALTEDDTREAPFSHDDETAEPGYYAVTFENGIRTELTATDRTGWHRFTFPAGEPATVVLDLEHVVADDDEPIAGGEVYLDPQEGIIEGWVVNLGSFTQRYGGNPVYFSARFTPAPVAWGVWGDTEPQPGETAAAGVDLGAWFVFSPSPSSDTGDPEDTGNPEDTGGTGDTGATETGADTADTASEGGGRVGVVEGRSLQVHTQVGISFSGLTQARGNLVSETEGAGHGPRDFDRVRERTRDAWAEQLRRIRVEGGSEEERTIFYTAVFHALQMPTLMSDADGSYAGFDGRIHTIEEGRYYSDFSLWDTYRTLHPLLLLAWPEFSRDFARSLLLMAEQGGYLPRWPCNRGYSGAMIGDGADLVLGETWLKGIRDWEGEDAFRAAQVTADGPTPEGAAYGGRGGIEDYLELGWVPGDEHSKAAARTLEFAWADHALSRWARALGLTKEAERYAERASWYANTWDEELGFFRARNADGTFPDPDDFSETSWRDDYAEGNAWQYLWMVPHDVEGLAALMGGTDACLDRLDTFFAESLEEEDDYLADTWYWHGNEPDIHAPYLYALLGEPERGVPWIRWVRETRYSDEPDGLDGNDDGGTLSAWYVLSALGLFPVAGTDRYALGPPLFEEAEVDTPQGPLNIEVVGVGGARYGSWREVALNGEPVTGGVVTHDDLAGGHLVFRVDGEDEPLEGER